MLEMNQDIIEQTQQQIYNIIQIKIPNKKKQTTHSHTMQQPNIKQLNEFISIDMQGLLGKGSTGNVYKGINQQPHTHSIAIKAIPLEEINNQVTKYLLECQLQALKCTSKVRNQSIVKLEQIIVRDGYCYIATQLLEGGTLKDYIAQSKKISPPTALTILRKLLQGYKILKDNGIIHRDLKPQNVLFLTNPKNGQQLIPKIIDFGYCIVGAVKSIPKMFYNVGSPRYMSPQAYTSNKYSEKSDIWALGIIFYQMLTGTTFDKGKNIVETFKLIKEKGIPIPSSLNNRCRTIIQHMLMLDPNARYTCEQILKEIRQIQLQTEAEAPINSFNQKMNPNIPMNKNLKQLRSTIINQRRMVPPSPSSRSPDPRTSLLTSNAQLRASGFLTKSLGFVVSPNSRDNRFNIFNYANQMNLKMDRVSLQNKSFNEQYRQGPLSDRKNRDNEVLKNLRQTTPNMNINFNPIPRQNEKFAQFKTYIEAQQIIPVNRSLQESTSQQNLHKIQAQNKQIHNNTARNQRQFVQNLSKQKQVGRRLFQHHQEINQMNSQNNKLNMIPFENDFVQSHKKITSPLVNTPFHTRMSIATITDNQTQNSIQSNQRVNFIKPNQQKRPQPQIHVINNQMTPQNQQQHMMPQFSHQQFPFVQHQQQPHLVQMQPPITMQLTQPTHMHMQQIHQTFSPSVTQVALPQPQPQSHLHYIQHQVHGQVNNHHPHPPTQVHFQSYMPPSDKNVNNVRILPINPQNEAMVVRGGKPQYNFLHNQLHIRPKFIEQTHI